jgi:hypothetical protein
MLTLQTTALMPFVSIAIVWSLGTSAVIGGTSAVIGVRPLALRDVMCQKVPSNSSLSGLDMHRGSLGVKKTRRNSTESTEDVSILTRY